MSEQIKIGGRLHSIAEGNVTTGANEILDDSKGKKQDVINQETDAELERLNNAKQDNLTFDTTPTEGSTNPITSGGVYAADGVLQQAIEAILLLIPSAASALNQLADKAFVNSTVATNTATFRGTYNVVSDLELHYDATHQQIATALLSKIQTSDNNDYCFVQIPISDSSGDIRVTERYKFNGTAWAYEYDLNNSGFTAAQWAAINSTITLALVQKLNALPNASELATQLAGKQNTLTFDDAPVAGSNNPVKSGGLYAAFQAINAKIPDGASADNKLVAESRLAEYVASVVGALDATYNVTSTDGHVNVRLTQVDGAITSVEVLTNDIASAAALNTLTGRVSTAESDIDALQDAYAALTQSDVVIVNGALPSSGQQQNIIYRQPDQDHTPPQFYSDYMWNGTTWVLMATYNNAIDPRPKKGSQNLVTSGGVFDNMGALDVSELKATENPHTLATYADLSAALAAIPPDYQKGGMSIKFVQSSDNKYVQYRLMADDWSTDTEDWAIVVEGVYVDNPEFTEVDVDKDNKILWGIQKDGNFYFGAGCPQQVKDYVLARKDEILTLLADKVDKVAGKGLSANDYTNDDKEIVTLQKIVDNLEFIDAVIDNDNKILYGVKRDGDFFFGAGVPKQIQDYVNSENMFENIEWIDNHFMYNRGTLNQNAGAYDWAEDTKYSYSKPFFMKKGDMIEWDGNGESLRKEFPDPADACVCETTEVGGANESYPILNQIYISENADYYRFIASKDMWVSCNILKATKDEKHFKWYRLKAYVPVDEKGVRATPLESSEVRDLLQQCKTREENPNQTGVFYTPQLCLLHFSDYHNDIGRLHRVLQFKKKWSDYIDDVIHTGDAAGDVYSSFDIKALELDGYKTMLNVIGNHDVYTNNYADSVSQKDKYDRYMKGMANAESINNNIASWGVVQPAGVGTDDYYPCYYYKDYSDMKVRLIVLDSMEYFGIGGTERNQVQLDWFISVLNNTPSDVHVIVADHYPPMNDLNDKTLLKGGFNRIGDPNYNSTSLEGQYIQDYVDAIDDYINGGGIFICWLCGHLHYDRTALIAAHPKQLFLLVPAANVTGNIQNRKRTVGEESEDLFNIVAIDTFTKVIRVARVGSKFDRDLQHQGTMCISYDTTNGNEIKLLSSY